MARRIIALEKDLFFSVKIRDTLQHHDFEVATPRTLAAFEQRLQAEGDERPVLAIVNTASAGIDWEAAIRAARGSRMAAAGERVSP